MSIWTKITGRAEKIEAKDINLASPELLSLFGGVATASGVTIGEGVAMRQPTAGAAIRLIAATVQTTPMHLFKKAADGSRERAVDHPAEKIVSGFANGWMPASELRRDITYRAIHDGRAFALISKVRGQVREAIPLPFAAVRRDVDETSGEPSYTLALKAGGTRRYGFSEILEVAPWGGRSLVKDAAEPIGRAVIMERHATRLFTHGKPSGILKVPGRLTELAAQRIASAWNSSFGGENSGRTAVLEENASWESVTLKSVDSQYLETLKLTLEDICRSFSVPPTLVGDLEHSVWKAPEQLAQQFLQFAMMPLFDHWQGALSRCLLTDADRAAGYFFEFNLDNFAKADLATRVAAYSQAITARILNPNEVRGMENRGPYVGGDEYANPAISPGPAASPTDEPDDE